MGRSDITEKDCSVSIFEVNIVHLSLALKWNGLTEIILYIFILINYTYTYKLYFINSLNFNIHELHFN